MRILIKMLTFLIDLFWFVNLYLFFITKPVLSFFCTVYLIRTYIYWETDAGKEILMFLLYFSILTLLIMFQSNYKPKNFSR